MRVKKIKAIIDQENRTLELCPNCKGHGWNWSDLEFGDAPGDEEKVCCGLCAGTGRVATVEATAIVTVPFDFKPES